MKRGGNVSELFIQFARIVLSSHTSLNYSKRCPESTLDNHANSGDKNIFFLNNKKETLDT